MSLERDFFTYSNTIMKNIVIDKPETKIILITAQEDDGVTRNSFSGNRFRIFLIREDAENYYGHGVDPYYDTIVTFPKYAWKELPL